ncbi:MAG TPA: Ig-like domain-containing protein, partial [Polyangia bacterium]
PPSDAGAPAADAGMPTVPADMTPVTITFSAPVDLAKDVIDIRITANGTPLTIITMVPDAGAPGAILAASPTPTTITLTPIDTWPANSPISVTVAATATDLLGDELPTAAGRSFTTGS